MDKKKPIKISLIISHNRDGFKAFTTHDNCHIHFKDRTLDFIDCKIQKAKYLIACTAFLNRAKEVNFHWGEHHFDLFKQTPICKKRRLNSKKSNAL